MVTAGKKAVRAARSRRARRSWWLWLGAAAICLTLTIYFWHAVFVAWEIVEILYPDTEAEVGSHLAVRGISKGLRASSKIAVAVYSGGVYQVHYDHTIVASDGAWCSSHVTVGDEADYGKNFTILALLVTNDVLEELRDYLRNPSKRPLTSLPRQARVVDEIPVHRRSADTSASSGSNCPAFPVQTPALRERQVPFTLNLLGSVAGILGVALSISQLMFHRPLKLRSSRKPSRGN